MDHPVREPPQARLPLNAGSSQFNGINGVNGVHEERRERTGTPRPPPLPIRPTPLRLEHINGSARRINGVGRDEHGPYSDIPLLQRQSPSPTYNPYHPSSPRRHMTSPIPGLPVQMPIRTRSTRSDDSERMVALARIQARPQTGTQQQGAQASPRQDQPQPQLQAQQPQPQPQPQYQSPGLAQNGSDESNPPSLGPRMRGGATGDCFKEPCGCCAHWCGRFWEGGLFTIILGGED
ncbi:hypothetical protein GGR54DRAFT_654638 [Hypoxylon sp. NC1633]|nr:hypothetical protein GGR54DRAFT_654638 [Hypoxylon sp. NC1633]